jgi:exodeoxyribonuclease-5
VGSDFSPALNKEYLENHFPMIAVTECRLTEVLRQAEDSEVLRNATLLRNTDWVDYPKFDIKPGGDLIRLNGLELQDQLESSYSNVGGEETILITRSNKQANAYNQQIRGRILWDEEALCSGDILMIVKNNYYWLGEDTKIGFIANGEMVRIVRVQKMEHLHGFEFAHLIVRFVDYEELGEVEVIIHTESLTVDAPSLSRERMKELFFSVERDYGHIREKKKRYEAILADPYFNALQVKYAYAVTCHKSQGGQWSDVFIDQGYITEETLNADYYRWLYTALTRATNRVYLVNFSDEFFE